MCSCATICDYTFAHHKYNRTAFGETALTHVTPQWPAVILWLQDSVCARRSCLYLKTRQSSMYPSCSNGGFQTFCKALWRRYEGSGWTKGEPLLQWQSLLPRLHPPPLLLVLILLDVSMAHVCECQWIAALWLFYELHYWFPILLRTENAVMHWPSHTQTFLAI